MTGITLILSVVTIFSVVFNIAFYIEILALAARVNRMDKEYWIFRSGDFYLPEPKVERQDSQNQLQ